MTLQQNYYDDVERYEVPSKRCCDNPLPHTHDESTVPSNLYTAGDQYAAADRVPAGRRRKESHVYTQIPVCSKQHRELLTRHTRWLVILSVITLLSLLLAISSLALVFMGMCQTLAGVIIRCQVSWVGPARAGCRPEDLRSHFYPYMYATTLPAVGCRRAASIHSTVYAHCLTVQPGVGLRFWLH